MTEAVILCGGLGTRLREETEFKPKPMVAIGDKPILWHIMSHYRAHGVRDFILCLGYKGEVIRDYFLNFRNYSNDVQIDLSSGTVTALSEEKTDWRVTLVDTGATAQTGARVRRASRFVKGDKFFVTYGDGVANIDIGKLFEFHNAEGKKATVTAVRPPSRFGELLLEDNVVRSFVEKPQTGAGWINGGFCVFDTATMRGLPDKDDLSLEAHVLEQLAADGELSVFKHAGFWQCMDTYREMQILNDMWASGTAPWKTA
ncbi:MAG TPA: glucose-1-phosphate cytidylyltransferase [Verrucomicrobiae bacterium]|nr:glucose-1-phosphate cytidylyltransferase [Verrucomicrobiae bacterium]